MKAIQRLWSRFLAWRKSRAQARLTSRIMAEYDAKFQENWGRRQG